MFFAITAGKYCKETSEDSWERQMEEQIELFTLAIR
jgi:hypothetical protein